MKSMRERRFKVESVADPLIAVAGDEAVHALRALRLKIDDAVVLFDGQGREVQGRIHAVSRAAFEVEVSGPVRKRSPRRLRLILAVATPKGQRADWLVEKCSELGVEALVPLETARGPVVPGRGKHARWQRKAQEAAKQAGHAHIMRIEPPRVLTEALDHLAADTLILYGDPGPHRPRLIDVLSETSVRHGEFTHIAMFIGPEGGFVPREREALEQRGGRGVCLGDAVLRIETAAVAAASVFACRVIE